jgi:hypothetical protein
MRPGCDEIFGASGGFDIAPAVDLTAGALFSHPESFVFQANDSSPCSVVLCIMRPLSSG